MSIEEGVALFMNTGKTMMTYEFNMRKITTPLLIALLKEVSSRGTQPSHYRWGYRMQFHLGNGGVNGLRFL
ncbi:MAG: hypothetical protein LCI00_08470 [Chloroflexi bacterium]|nr:hypothetical protein [Chloroflexota bacterium]